MLKLKAEIWVLGFEGGGEEIDIQADRSSQHIPEKDQNPCSPESRRSNEEKSEPMLDLDRP